MNSSIFEEMLVLVAKPCGPQDRERKIIYSVLDSGDIFCLDKKEMILSQLEACQRLLNCNMPEVDRALVKKEMSELRLALDLIS